MWTAVVVASALTATPFEGHRDSRPVVFVCEHGSVKSLIAREWFDRLAAARGLSVRSASRGLTPDERVPAPIAARMSKEGLDVETFEPRRLTATDAAGAQLVVGIGVDIPAFPDAKPAVTKWDGIPPASEGYPATRDALRDRIEKLLDALATVKKGK